MKAVHNVLYTKKHTQTNASYPVMDNSCIYAFKGWGVDLEVEGVRYIEMHRGPHTCYIDLPPSRGGDLDLEGGVNVCVLVKIWSSTWNTYLVWRLNVVR